ncbi:MAG: ATP-binding cassette domain-containing protein [Synergistaceae bacterium]|jgi:peptide/nickel transport system ATP-binding protein|nr:ATP-binding cassette domain-containing protein [Synergistaceae bacterium]
MSEVLLDVRGIKKYFKTPKGLLHAVDNVSFTLNRGETMGLVGESGCGKSTAGRVILRLIEATEGEIFFEGHDIRKYGADEMRRKRREMQIIFQDPFSSINPRKTISETIEEPLKLHGLIPDKYERMEKVVEIMETVGLAERLMNAYPHELDGGRRQRVGIARAFALNPKFVVCDEPVSALDVSIQAQILNLMKELQEKTGLAYLFITHDLSVVNHFSDNIAVMYLGEIIETAPAELLFSNPLHPYTQALLSAIPVPNLKKKRQRVLLKGEITSPVEPEPVCRFCNRCLYADERCRQGEPRLQEVESGHKVACFRVGCLG